MRKIFGKYRIRIKIFLLFILLILIPYLVLILVTYQVFQDYAGDNAGKNMEDVMISIGNQVGASLKTYEDSTMSLYYNGCVDMLENQEADREYIEATLAACCYSYSGIRAAYLVSDGRVYYNGAEKYGNLLQVMESHYKEIVANGGKYSWYATDELFGKHGSHHYILARTLNGKYEKNIGTLIIYTGFTIFVLGITVMDSLKSQGDLVTNFVGLPKELTLENYRTVLMESDLLVYLRNSVIATVGGTLGCLLLAGLTAYGISRFEFKGKGILSSYFLVGMMVPVQVSILPLFLILRKLGLLNNILGLVLVYISGISMACFIFQKFFRTIPVALEESARIDGAGDFKIFFKIIVPLCKPVIMTVALITAIGEWNDFYMPMILLGKKASHTLTLVIYQYVGQFTRYMGESMAAVVIALIPIIILYFAFSSQIVEGITGGAVKG